MKKILFLTLATVTLLMSLACHRPTTPAEQSEEPAQTRPSQPITVEGRLIIGHEVSSFVADGDTTEYWVTDTTGMLQERYRQTVGEQAKPYTPVKVALQVTDCGKSTEGFAAEYDGVYRVEQIINIAPLAP